MMLPAHQNALSNKNLLRSLRRCVLRLERLTSPENALTWPCGPPTSCVYDGGGAISICVLRTSRNPHHHRSTMRHCISRCHGVRHVRIDPSILLLRRHGHRCLTIHRHLTRSDRLDRSWLTIPGYPCGGIGPPIYAMSISGVITQISRL